ncbi:hypothetical protein THAOC_07152, partial [Thalassiosira oceanica]
MTSLDSDSMIQTTLGAGKAIAWRRAGQVFLSTMGRMLTTTMFIMGLKSAELQNAQIFVETMTSPGRLVFHVEPWPMVHVRLLVWLGTEWVVPVNATDPDMGGGAYTEYGLTGGGNGGSGPASAPYNDLSSTYYACFTRNDYVYTTENSDEQSHNRKPLKVANGQPNKK